METIKWWNSIQTEMESYRLQLQAVTMAHGDGLDRHQVAKALEKKKVNKVNQINQMNLNKQMPSLLQELCYNKKKGQKMASRSLSEDMRQKNSL